MEEYWGEEILKLINESEEALINYYKKIEPLNESGLIENKEIKFIKKEKETIDSNKTLRELLEDSEVKTISSYPLV